MSRNAISAYLGRRRVMEDAVAINCAKLAGLPPAYVLACISAERTKAPAARRIYRQLAAMALAANEGGRNG